MQTQNTTHVIPKTAGNFSTKVPSILPLLNIFGGSCSKYHFVVSKICLLQQNYVCRDKQVSQENICGNKQFCYNKTTSILLSQQKCVCCNKSMLVATKLLSWQNYVCCDNSFATTSILLLQQKTCFVTTKIILVAATTNDSWKGQGCFPHYNCSRHSPLIPLPSSRKLSLMGCGPSSWFTSLPPLPDEVTLLCGDKGACSVSEGDRPRPTTKPPEPPWTAGCIWSQSVTVFSGFWTRKGRGLFWTMEVVRRRGVCMFGWLLVPAPRSSHTDNGNNTHTLTKHILSRFMK